MYKRHGGALVGSLNMSLHEAHLILNMVKEGYSVPLGFVHLALTLTGDL